MISHTKNIVLIIIEIFCFSIIFSNFLISEEIFSSRSRIGVIKNQKCIHSERTGFRTGGMPVSSNSTLPRKHYEIFEETDRYFETIDKQQALDNYNDREFVRKQIFVKPDCSVETKKLVYAITAGDYRTADSVKEKADLNYKDKYGNSVLLCHTNRGIGADLSEQVTWFINNGIDVGQVIYRWERGSLQPDGTFKTWKEYELFSERLIYNSRALSVLIRKRPDLINIHDPHDGHTLLMRAADAADLEILEILLANNANIEAKDDQGYTPLIYAITEGNYPNTLLLLSYGANSKISFKINEYSREKDQYFRNEYHDINDYIQNSLSSLREDKTWNQQQSRGKLSGRELVLMNAKKSVKMFPSVQILVCILGLTWVVWVVFLFFLLA
jgi:ankyrin repeat protein